ncbi:type II 3-dehydroquinate dehydratase [Candidatus Riesia pediculischaeffi]|uniref:type II 3-dehydroquinate dehydratase n=1 Tax=Candidatus Riesia pediculischaeffi TaxID=428411 RepID=UPI0005AC71DB|nr:type II 3-dehydroquinate dehydratase [Candidatus Riesia pediculischaeffi]
MTYKNCDVHILLINGPNMNVLERREKDLYLGISLKEIIGKMKKKAKRIGVSLTFFQSNAEHEIVDLIHSSYKNIDFILINPGAFAHTSIALRDAMLSSAVPFYEIHVTNIYSRESFRKKSYLSDIAEGVICGFYGQGYIYALEAAVNFLSIRGSLSMKKNTETRDGYPKNKKNH